MNQRLSNAPTTHRTRSLREQESAFSTNVARGQEHQASTALKVSRFHTQQTENTYFGYKPQIVSQLSITLRRFRWEGDTLDSLSD